MCCLSAGLVTARWVREPRFEDENEAVFLSLADDQLAR